MPESDTDSAPDTDSAADTDSARRTAAAPATSHRRRAALISTAIAAPVTVFLALAFTAGRHPDAATGPPPVLSVAAVPPPPGSDAICAAVLRRVPVTLSGLATRRVSSVSTSVAAWGDPAVVLRCGVPRPAALVPQSASYVQEIGDSAGRTVEWLPETQKHQTVWTTIDRTIYVEVTVPKKYDGASMITPLTTAVAAATPAVCRAQPNPPPATPLPDLCVNRK